MVRTSARNAGGPWFDSRSRLDRLLYATSVFYTCIISCLLYRAVLSFIVYIYIYIYIYIYMEILSSTVQNPICT